MMSRSIEQINHFEDLNKEVVEVLNPAKDNEHLSPEYLAKNPYPGLNYYEEEREEYFNGRDKEKQGILEILSLHSLCFLIGKSGIGKTSLINAGLIPEFRKKDFVPITIRINFDIKVNLTEQVKNRIETVIHTVDKNALLFTEGKLLWEYFQELKIFKGYLRPILIFDQFEEIFTRGNERQQELNSLLKELIDLAENSVPDKVQREYTRDNKTIPSNFKKDYQIIFSLREDYLPQLTGLRIYIPTLRYSVFRLEQIPSTEAYKAVFYPAQNAKLLDENTATQIVAKIPESKNNEFDFSIDDTANSLNEPANSPDNKKIEPFLLNLLCYTLNEERKSKHLKVISAADVARKNLGTLVQEYYERTTKSKTGMSIAIEEELITRNGKYRKFSEKDVFVKAGKLNEDDVTFLINNKLIRRRRINSLEYLELIHDILIPIVLQKRERRSRFKAARRTLFLILSTILLFGAIAFYSVEKKLAEEKKERQAELEKTRDKIKQASIDFKNKVRQLDIDEKAKNLELENQRRQFAIYKQKDSFDLAISQAALKIEQEKLLAKTEEEKLKVEKESLLLEQQKISITKDSLAVRNALDELKNKTFSDSLSHEFAALILSQKARVQNSNKPAEKTLAKLAFDTLYKPKGVNTDNLFNPEVYSVLADAMIDTFRFTKYWKYQYLRKMQYKNIDNILVANDKYYITLPFDSVVDNSGTAILSDTGLIHSWLSGDGSFLAYVSIMNDNGRIKRLRIKDLKAGKIVNDIPLSVDQDVVSLVFETGNTYCVYSTIFPGALFKLKVVSKERSGPPIMEFVGKEYIFLQGGQGKELFGVTNYGKYYKWPDYQFLNDGFVKNLQEKSQVSAISYSPSDEGGLFVGYENGNIYKVNPSNIFNLILSEAKVKITSLSCSNDGKWLAAGYQFGGLILKKLDSKEIAPASILPNSASVYSYDEIVALCFTSKSDHLIAASGNGYIWKFPVSMNAIAMMICNENKYLKPNDPKWSVYIPNAKNIKICP